MKLDNERLDAYEEAAVNEYVNEYGGEAGSAAPADGVPDKSQHATRKGARDGRAIVVQGTHRKGIFQRVPRGHERPR